MAFHNDHDAVGKFLKPLLIGVLKKEEAKEVCKRCVCCCVGVHVYIFISQTLVCLPVSFSHGILAEHCPLKTSS